MFGNNKLKQRIFDLEIKLQNERKESERKSSAALKQLYALIVKPKYKVGQKVWAYRYTGYGSTYVFGVIVNVRVDVLCCGGLCYHYRIADEQQIDIDVSEYSVYKTKPTP